MTTQAHLNKAKAEGGTQRRRKSSLQRPRCEIGVELMVLALSNRLGEPFDDGAHLRLVQLAYDLGARAEQLPEKIRAQLAAANPFAKGYLYGDPDQAGAAVAVREELGAQHDQVQAGAGAAVGPVPEREHLKHCHICNDPRLELCPIGAHLMDAARLSFAERIKALSGNPPTKGGQHVG